MALSIAELQAQINNPTPPPPTTPVLPGAPRVGARYIGSTSIQEGPELGKYGQGATESTLPLLGNIKGYNQNDLAALLTGAGQGVINTVVGTAQGFTAIAASPFIIADAMGDKTIKEALINYVESPAFQGFEEAKTAVRELLPVHRQKGFHTFEWLGANVENMLTTFSLAFPAWAATRGLAAGATRGIGLLGEAGAAMKASTAAAGWGIGVEAQAIGKQALALANYLKGATPAMKQVATGITMAAISRPIESMLEADQTGKATYRYAKDVLGLSEEEALKMKHNAMGTAYEFNIYLGILDAIQYATMLPGFKGLNRIIDGNMLTKVASSAFTEGMEEVVQFGISEEAQRKALGQYSPMSEMDWMGRMNQYIQDPQLWESFVLGAFGGAIMSAGLPAADNVLVKQFNNLRSKIDETYRETQRLVESRTATETAKAAATTTAELRTLDQKDIYKDSIPTIARQALNEKSLATVLTDAEAHAAKSEDVLKQERNPTGEKKTTLFGHQTTEKELAKFGLEMAQEAKRLRAEGLEKLDKAIPLIAYIQDGLTLFAARKEAQLAKDAVVFNNIKEGEPLDGVKATAEAAAQAKKAVTKAAAENFLTDAELAGTPIHPAIKAELTAIANDGSVQSSNHYDEAAFDLLQAQYAAENALFLAKEEADKWSSSGSRAVKSAAAEKSAKEAAEESKAQLEELVKKFNAQQVNDILTGAQSNLGLIMKDAVAALPPITSEEDRQKQIEEITKLYNEKKALTSTEAKAQLEKLGMESELGKFASDGRVLTAAIAQINAKNIQTPVAPVTPTAPVAPVETPAGTAPAQADTPAPVVTTETPVETLPADVPPPGVPPTDNPPGIGAPSEAVAEEVDPKKNNRLHFDAEMEGKNGEKNAFEHNKVKLVPVFTPSQNPDAYKHLQMLDPDVLKAGKQVEVFVPTVERPWLAAPSVKRSPAVKMGTTVTFNSAYTDVLNSMTYEKVMKPTTEKEKHIAQLVKFAPICVRAPETEVIDSPVQLPFSTTGLDMATYYPERIGLRLAILQAWAAGVKSVPVQIEKTQQGAFTVMPERQSTTNVIRNTKEVTFAIVTGAGRLEALDPTSDMVGQLRAEDTKGPANSEGWPYLIIPTFNSDVQGDKTGRVPLWKVRLSASHQEVLFHLLQNYTTLTNSGELEPKRLRDKNGIPTKDVQIAIESLVYATKSTNPEKKSLIRVVQTTTGVNYALTYRIPPATDPNNTKAGWKTLIVTEQQLQNDPEMQRQAKEAISYMEYNVEKRTDYQDLQLVNGEIQIEDVPMHKQVAARTETSMPIPRQALDAEGKPKLDSAGNPRYIYTVHPGIHLNYGQGTKAAQEAVKNAAPVSAPVISTPPASVSVPVTEEPPVVPAQTTPAAVAATVKQPVLFKDDQIAEMLDISERLFQGDYETQATTGEVWLDLEPAESKAMFLDAFAKYKASGAQINFEAWLRNQRQGSPLEVPYGASPNTAALVERLKELENNPDMFTRVFIREILLSADKELAAFGYKLWNVLQGQDVKIVFKELQHGNVARALDKTIYIDINQIPFVDRHFSYILAHEASHIALDSVLTNPKTPQEKAFKEEMLRLMKEAESVIKDFPNISKHTDTTRLLEFMAEVRSNPAFASRLKEKGPRSIWQRIWDAVMNFFGVKNKTLFDVISSTMDQQLRMDATLQAMDSSLEIPTSVNYTYIFEMLQTVNSLAMRLVNDTNVPFDVVSIYHDKGGVFDQLKEKSGRMSPEVKAIYENIMTKPEVVDYIVSKSWSYLNMASDFIMEEEDMDTDSQPEETGDRGVVQKSSFEVSAKTRATKAARAMLSRIYERKPIKNRTGEVVGYMVVNDRFGFPKNIPFDTLWNQLTIVLADRSVDEILPTMYTLSDYNTNIKAVLDTMLNLSEKHLNEFRVQVKKADYKAMAGDALFSSMSELDREAVVTEFITLMTKQNSSFLSVSFENAEVRNANWHSAARVVASQWYEQYKASNLVTMGTVGLVPNTAEVKKLREEYEAESALHPNDPAVVLRALGKLGITFVRTDGTDIVPQLTELIRKEPRLFKFLGKRYGSSSSGIMTYLASAAKDIFKAMETPSTADTDRVSHAFALRSSDIEKLARMKLLVDPTTQSDMFRSQSKKMIYTINQPTLLSDRMQDLERGIVDPILLQSPFSQDNYFIKEFLERGMSPLKLYYMSTFGKVGKHKDYNDLTVPDRWIARLMMYHHSNNDEGYFETPQHADKPMVPVIKAPKRKVSMTKTKEGAEVIDLGTTAIVARHILLSEIKRIILAQDAVKRLPKEKLTANYHLGKKDGPAAALQFQFFHQHGMDLNTMPVTINGHKTTLLDAVRNMDAEQLPLLETHYLPQIENSLRPFLTEYLTKEREALKAELELNGVYNPTSNSLTTTELFKGMVTPPVDSFLSEFIVNYWIMNASYYQLISGDPAFASPDSKGFVAVDLFKRLAMDIAPGLASTLPGDMNMVIGEDNEAKGAFHTLWANELFRQFKADPRFKGQSDAELQARVTKHLKAFENITETDGQAMVSLDEYERLLKGWGRLTRKQKEIIDKAKAGTLTLTEMTDYPLSVLKPVIVVDHYDEESRTVIRKYVKMSVLPAVPQVLKGSKYEKLFSTKSDMGWFVYKSGIKLGSSNVLKADWDTQTDLTGHLNNHIHKLSYKGLRLQQEAAYHRKKKEVRTVSQARKLLFQDLLDLLPPDEAKKIELGGNKWGSTIEALKTHYDKLFIANIEEARDAMKFDFGMDFTQDVPVVTNIKRLNELLQEEMTSRGYSENMKQALALLPEDESPKDANGNPILQFRMPLYITPTSLEFEGLLFSIISNRLIKQKRNGRSYIQASPYGILPASNVSTIVPPAALAQLQADGVLPEQSLYGIFVNSKDVLEPGEVLLPAKYYANLKGRTHIPLEELKEIEADKVFAMRIPNQGHSSMAAVKIKGYLPAAMGDLVIIHPDLVAQMGSDFDVDKLYIYSPHLEMHYTPSKKHKSGKLRQSPRRVSYIPIDAPDITIYDTDGEAITMSSLEYRYWRKVHERSAQALKELKREYAPQFEEINRLIDTYKNLPWVNELIRDSIKAYEAQLDDISDAEEASNLLPRQASIPELMTYLGGLISFSSPEAMKAAKEWKRQFVQEQKTKSRTAYFEHHKQHKAEFRKYVNEEIQKLKLAQTGQKNLMEGFVKQRKELLQLLTNMVYEQLTTAPMPLSEEEQRNGTTPYIPATLDEFATWSEEKQNTRKARENRMLEIELGISERKPMLQKFTEANTYEPWTSAITEMTGKSLDELREPANPLSILASDKAWKMNQGAKTGVATASLWSTWASQMQYTPLMLSPSKNGKFESPGVKFSGIPMTKVDNLPHYAYPEYGAVRFPAERGYFGPDRITFLNQVIQSVMVDDAKNQVAGLGNLGDQTLSTALFLINMGVNDMRYIVGMLTQPAVLRFAREAAAGESVLSKWEEDKEAAILKRIEDDYLLKLTKLGGEPLSPPYSAVDGQYNIRPFTLKELKDNMTPQETIEHYQMQLEAIKAWRYYYTLAEGTKADPGMIQMIGALNIDTKGVGKNYYAVYQKTKSISRVLEDSKWDNVKEALAGTTFMELKRMVEKAQRVYTNSTYVPALLPYKLQLFDMFYNAKKSHFKFIHEDLAMDAAQGAYAYMTSHLGSGLYPKWVKTAEDLQKYRKELLVPSTKTIAGKEVKDSSTTLFGRIMAARQTSASKYWIIQRLSVNDRETSFDAVEFQRNTVEKSEHDLLIASLGQMLVDPDQTVQQLAKDIIAYSYLTKGVAMSSTGWTHLIPLGYLGDVYAKFFREQINLFNTDEHEANFMDQWYRNYPEYAHRLENAPTAQTAKDVKAPYAYHKPRNAKVPTLYKRVENEQTKTFEYIPVPLLGTRDVAYTVEFNANGVLENSIHAQPEPLAPQGSPGASTKTVTTTAGYNVADYQYSDGQSDSYEDEGKSVDAINTPAQQANAAITSFSDGYFWLSNFKPATVTLDGVQYPTVEHAYQAAKFLDPALREQIRAIQKPGDAKKKARALEKDNLRSDWKQVNLSIMRDLLYQKFTGNMAKNLINTGTKPLIEGNSWGDTFWGVDERTGLGENRLGQMLMEIRTELTNNYGVSVAEWNRMSPEEQQKTKECFGEGL